MHYTTHKKIGGQTLALIPFE